MAKIGKTDGDSGAVGELEPPVSKTAAPPRPATAQPASGSQPAAAAQIRVDDANVIASYANFCRVTGTPEEMIIDFGLNPQPMTTPTEPIALTQRIVTNYYTAKRLWHALQLTLQRHEAAFGVLETDVQKRVVFSGRS